MSLMILKFGNNVAGINVAQIRNNQDVDLTFRKLFFGLDFKDDLVTIDKFVELLKNNNWYISSKIVYPTGYEDINPDKYIDYIFNSSDRQVKLHLLFPNEFTRDEFKNNYNVALRKLIELSENAIVINDKDDQQDYIYQSKRYNGKKNMPTIRRIFKNKKVKIALCTLGVAVTVVVGSIIIQGVQTIIDAQKTIDSAKEYSYQNSLSDYSHDDSQLYRAIKHGQYDAIKENPNGQEEYKMNYNDLYYKN